MNNNFLPKAFDASGKDEFCSCCEIGEIKTAPHWHSGAEIIFVEAGVASIFFDNSWHRIEGGSLIFIPPGRIHCTSCTERSNRRTVLGFTARCLGDEHFSAYLPRGIEKHCIFTELEKTPLAEYISKFNRLSNESGICNRLLAKSLIYQIFVYILNAWEARGASLPKRQDVRCKEIFDYIDLYFKEDISPYSAASALNQSYSSLAKKLKEISNTTFSRELNRRRVDEAKRLLISSSESVTEIGANCGFCDTSYFIKTFRKLTGATPLAYRMAANKEI